VVVGRIMRVSGPLVVAEGMRGSMVYEVVYVGEERLIGEIIGMQEDKAFIQVYEDTTGLKVGEPVEGSGSLLSAELGPGIVGKVFDGLQRPLSTIGELIGPFVKRGIKLPALPRNIKWYFKRSKDVKIGDKVGPGDVIGVVKETELIDHYIMVPPNVHGTLKELVNDGDYTVEDVIAVIESNGVKHYVRLMQRWPVRKPRPYSSRLEPTEPLITGQRVLDLMFPIARGGKAAVPGGFGSGKCVPPGTPVLLTNWDLIPIDELYRNAEGRRIKLNDKEELIELKKPINVLGFDGIRFKVVKATHIYKGYTDKLIEIKTSTGKTLKVTPNHKLPVIDSYGTVRYIKAIDIRPGMHLIVPKKVPLVGNEPKIPIERLAKYEDVVSKDAEVNERVREFLNKLSMKDLKELCNTVGISLSTLNDIKKRKRSIPLRLIVTIKKTFNVDLGSPRILGLRRSKLSLRIPLKVSEELAELLGLILADGSIVKNRVVFFNNSSELRRKFNDLLYKTFGLRGREKIANTVYAVEVTSSLLARFLKEVFDIPSKRKSRNAVVPRIIMKASPKIIAAFIRGLYLGDGSFHQSTLEISSSSPKLISGLAYLLLKLGISYSISKDEKYHRYRLFITSVRDLKKFYEIVLLNVSNLDISKIRKLKEYVSSKELGSILKDAVPLDPRFLKLIYRVLSKRKLGSEGINIGNYIYNGERLGYKTILKLKHVLMRSLDVRVTEALTLIERLKTLLSMLNYVTFERVEHVNVIKYEGEVYDLVVEETHNFIGGEVPVIYHNTVLLQTLTKWSRTKLNIYVGCGERGNEMADALHSFLRLKDPVSGRPLYEKAVFIANTSNMPVAARETSVFLGVTIGEYFRDMGYDVLMVADSTSRWAEAMREISARLEEMPGEEGFPAYLGSRLAEFYERSGRVKCLGRPKREGSLTIVGAVSPPGADFSEPVTQNTLRYIGTFIALDVALANRRHFPAVNWLMSYSLYVETVARWWSKRYPRWKEMRDRALSILQREAELMEIVRLVGPDALPDNDKLLLDVAKMIREDFLQQNAFHPIDCYCPPDKTVKILEIILKFYELSSKALEVGVPLEKVRALPVRAKIARLKHVPYEDFSKVYESLSKELADSFKKLMEGTS